MPATESSMRPRWRRALVSARSPPIGGYYTVAMRRMAFALLMLVSLAGRTQEHPDWFALSLMVLPEEIANAAKEQKRVVLYFEQDGCPYCKRMVEVTFRDPRVATRMKQGFVPIAINIWGENEVTTPEGKVMSEKQLAAHLKVQFTPTLLFFDEKGNVALRINGYYPPERFLPALDRAASAGPVAESAPASRKPRAKPLALVFETGKCAACDELQATLRHDR